MSSEPSNYSFGPFVLDRSRRLLLRDGLEVGLTPKAFDLLTVLVENEGRVVTKDELMEKLWPDTAVEESNLTFQVSYLRKALGGERLVTTIPGRGYQFVGRVQRGDTQFLGVPRVPRSSSEEDHQENRLAQVYPVAVQPPEEPEERRNPRNPSPEEPEELRGTPRHSPWRKLVKGTAALLVAAAILSAAGMILVQMRKAAAAPEASSIAVLPFKPIVAGQRDEALELGMADTLITRLSHVPGVTIRPTSAVRRFSALDQDPLEAGRALEVASVLEGTIQRSAGRMRVNVRLLRTEDGQTLWADHFDQPAAGLFDVQDRVADGVARSLAPALSGRAQERVARRTTSNLAAYDLYVQGNLWRDRDGSRALEFYERAIVLDSRFAAAYAAIAEAWLHRGRFRNSSPREQFENARQAAVKAIELDPELGEAHASLAAVYADWDWAWDRAEAEYRRALALNPNWVPAHTGYANLLLVRRRFDAAVHHSRRAIELDPTSFVAGVTHGVALRAAGRVDESIAQLQNVLEVHPGLVPALLNLGFSYSVAGRPNESVATFDEALRGRADSQQLGALRAYALAQAGRGDEARQALEQLEAAATGTVNPASVNLALAWYALGEKDRAFQWLDHAFRERLYLLRYIVWEPNCREIRRDARYRELARKMGL